MESFGVMRKKYKRHTYKTSPQDDDFLEKHMQLAFQKKRNNNNCNYIYIKRQLQLRIYI